MRCHSCDGWVDKNMNRCPACGRIVDDRSFEPPPTPVRVSTRPRPHWKDEITSKQVKRSASIGIVQAISDCPQGQNLPQSWHGSRCIRYEVRLLDINCKLGATCRLLEALPSPTEWKLLNAPLVSSKLPSNAQRRRIKRRDLQRCPSGWQWQATIGLGDHVVHCTRFVLVEETEKTRIEVKS